MIRCIAIDDEPKALDVLMRYCGRIETIQLLATFRQPLKTMDYITTEKPDLIFLDIWMPDMGGLELLRAWRRDGACDAVVIMMSGQATLDTAVEATRQGALDFLEKPISLQKFLAAVAHGLEHGRSVVQESAAVQASLLSPKSAKQAARMPAGNALAVDAPAPQARNSVAAALRLDLPLREARELFELSYFRFHLDAAQGTRDLSSHERLASARRLVVEEYAVAGKHVVGFAKVDHAPIGKELGHPVGTARIEGGGFLLRDLLHQAVELAGGSLVDPGSVRQTQHAHCFKDAQGAEGIAVGGVFRRFEAHSHMALGTEVIDLIGLDLLDDSDQVGAVREVAVVQHQAWIPFMWILIEMIDSRCVEAARTAFDAVHHIALL